MAIKKGDFITLDYVGKLASTGEIFDLTDEKLAKKSNLFNSQQKYGPVTICVGEGQLVKGIDTFLEGKEVGKEYNLEIEPELGFGKRTAKLIQLVSMKKFREQKMNPFPGARVMIDGMPATIRSISGGRILVDFNHQLAGKKLHYTVQINKKITDKIIQARSILEKQGANNSKILIGLEDKVLDIKFEGDQWKHFKKYVDKIKKDMLRLISDLKQVKVSEKSE